MPDTLTSDQFKELCRQEFHFLTDEYGFTERELPKIEFMNQVQVQFVNTTTLVAVEGLSYGQQVRVSIGRVEPEAWETNEKYYLGDLLEIRSPELSLIGPDGFSVSSDQAFQIKHYAHALKKCADDVLRGDLSIFPKLHEAIERRRKEYGPGFLERTAGLILFVVLWPWLWLLEGLRRLSKK